MHDTHTYNYPGASTFRCVRLAHNDKKTQAAANAWWHWVHDSEGPCAPGGGTTYTERESQRAKYRDGQPIFGNFVPVVYAPGDEPARIPRGWKLLKRDKFVLVYRECN